MPEDTEVVTTEEDSITAAGEVDVTDLPSEWHGVLTVEGLRTSDHRRISEGAISWRQLPQALFAQFKNAGHPDADIVGSIAEITREPWRDGMTLVKGKGTFDLSSDEGRKAARMVKDQTLRWGSVDLDAVESELVEIGGGEEDIIDILFGQEAASGYDWYENINLGRIMGFTLVATPAFPQAVVAPLGVELDIPDPMGEAPHVENGLVAGGMQIPIDPPSEWFANPELEGPTPLTIEGNGHVFGHVALWDTAHIGYDGVVVNPPRSERDYSYFTTGSILSAEGDQFRIGHITFDTGHAGSTADWRSAASHYDNTGSVAADITVGEDEHGIWFSGALRSTLTDEQIRLVRAHSLSGDWRKVGNSLELVATLSVNVPGFPIAASGTKPLALVAAGRLSNEQVSLITAGLRPRDPMAAMARELVVLREALAPLLPAAREALASRVNGKSPRTIVSIEDLRARVNG